MEWSFSSGGATTGHRDTAHAAYMACYEEHQIYIDYIWAVMNEPSEEEAQRGQALVVECVRESGIVMPAFGSTEFGAWIASGPPSEFFECIQRVQQETGISLGG